jgi:integrase
VLIITQETGIRPSEIYRMRIENVDFENRQIWNRYGKTTKSRRFVPISERMASVLTARCVRQDEGWVFPSARSKSGHILGNIHQTGSDGTLVENRNSLNKRYLMVGSEGFEPPAKGL